MDLEILKIASDTSNNKDIKKFTHFSKSKNPICGDEVHIKLIINNEKIKDFGYQGHSCIYCQASTSLLSKNLINYNKDNVNEICDFADDYFNKNNNKFKKKWNFLKKLFKKKNFSRKECILLPFNVLKKIVTE
tara:strand:- start:569 stop:967 length:399 start_codon:yes stop_codon:yes gene_type:complete